MARRNKGEEKTIARERIARLVSLAAGDPARANRYADLAWRVKTTYQLRQTAIDGRICRECKAFLVPGRTSRVRLRNGQRSTTCLACGVTRRKALIVRPAPPHRGGPSP